MGHADLDSVHHPHYTVPLGLQIFHLTEANIGCAHLSQSVDWQEQRRIFDGYAALLAASPPLHPPLHLMCCCCWARANDLHAASFHKLSPASPASLLGHAHLHLLSSSLQLPTRSPPNTHRPSHRPTSPPCSPPCSIRDSSSGVRLLFVTPEKVGCLLLSAGTGP